MYLAEVTNLNLLKDFYLGSNIIGSVGIASLLLNNLPDTKLYYFSNLITKMYLYS